MAVMTCALVERLETISDPRRQGENLKHRLVDLIVLGFWGVLAGCDDFVEIAEWGKLHEGFFRPFLELPHGIPAHDTFTRVFAMLQLLLVSFAAPLSSPPPCRRSCCHGCWSGGGYRATGFIWMAKPCGRPDARPRI